MTDESEGPTRQLKKSFGLQGLGCGDVREGWGLKFSGPFLEAAHGLRRDSHGK